MSGVTILDVQRYCTERMAAHNGYSACDACPIHGACTSDIGHLSGESLDGWRSRCVDSLSSVLGRGTGRAVAGVAVNG